MYLGFIEVEVDNTIKDIDDLGTIPTGTTGAELQCQAGAGGNINYTMDGSTNPGASKGMELRAEDPPKFFLLEDIRNIKFTRSSANTNLAVHWMGGRAI